MNNIEKTVNSILSELSDRSIYDPGEFDKEISDEIKEALIKIISNHQVPKKNENIMTDFKRLKTFEDIEQALKNNLQVYYSFGDYDETTGKYGWYYSKYKKSKNTSVSIDVPFVSVESSGCKFMHVDENGVFFYRKNSDDVVKFAVKI